MSPPTIRYSTCLVSNSSIEKALVEWELAISKKHAVVVTVTLILFMDWCFDCPCNEYCDQSNLDLNILALPAIWESFSRGHCSGQSQEFEV